MSHDEILLESFKRRCRSVYLDEKCALLQKQG
jgi:hypothetical protein